MPGDLEKVGQGHGPSKRNKEVAKMRLPSEYESSTTFRDKVITYQRVCVTDDLTGDVEKVGQGQWPSKGRKRLLRCIYFLKMEVLQHLGTKLSHIKGYV